MIRAIACLCGSSENLIRNFLKRCGYADWLTIPIEMGKERSIRLVEQMPACPEMAALKSYLGKTGKWAVIIGVDADGCYWEDISRGGPKAAIDAELLVERFA